MGREMSCAALSPPRSRGGRPGTRRVSVSLSASRRRARSQFFPVTCRKEPTLGLLIAARRRKRVSNTTACASERERDAFENSSLESTSTSTSSTNSDETNVTERFAFRILSVLAGAGAVETAYLTFTKVFSSSVFCPTAGCETILTSRYSELFGIPVSFFGCLTYAGVAYLSSLAVKER